MLLLPPIPLRLMQAGIGRFTLDGQFVPVRRDYYLTGPSGFRSILRVRIWSAHLSA
jgi:hypothetical protein